MNHQGLLLLTGEALFMCLAHLDRLEILSVSLWNGR